MRLNRRVVVATRGLRALLPSVTGLVAGVALAAAMLWVDSLSAPGPRALVIAVGPARDFLAALAGAAVTVTMLLVWVRGMLIQMVAGKLSMRVMRWYLDDWYLHIHFGLLLGMFSYAVTVLLSLSPSQVSAPLLSTVVAAVLAGLQLVMVVLVLHHSVHSTEVGQVLSTMTALALSTIRARHPESAVPQPDLPSSADLPARLLVTASSSGWVTGVDEGRLARALPPGAVVRFHVAVGTFVLEGSALAEVLAEQVTDHAAIQRAGRRHVSIEGTREIRSDVDFVISKLTDVIVRSLQPGAGETTTAYEATTQLLLVLREVLVRELPPRRVAHDGRTVVRTDVGSHRDYVDAAFSEIRETGLPVPRYAIFLMEWLVRLHQDLREQGAPERAELVRQEAERLVTRCGQQPWLEHDIDAVRNAARPLLAPTPAG